MATGDMANNAAKVKRQLHAIHYPHDLSTCVDTLARGNATDHLAELLRILHYALLDYSRHVARLVQAADLELYGKTDVKFVDGFLRFARDHMSYFANLTTAQMLSPQHFRERKMIILADILAHIVQIHTEESRRQKQQQAVWVQPTHKPSSQQQGDLMRVPSHHIVPAQVDDKASPWVSMNLGQPKATRVVRHNREVHRPHDCVGVYVSDASPSLRQAQHETSPPRQSHPILDWHTPIEDVSPHHDLDKEILNPSHHDVDSAKRRMWYTNQHDAGSDEDDDDDMYPRASINFQRAPSIDKTQLPSPPRPTNASCATSRPTESTHAASPPLSFDVILDALLKLEQNVASKMDALSTSIDAKFAALDTRVARLETVQDAVARSVARPAVPSASPNQEDATPRVMLSTFLTQSVDRQYKWPPEPSVFGHQSTRNATQ